jgi:probable HAF family extracellular repeat protein
MYPRLVQRVLCVFVMAFVCGTSGLLYAQAPPPRAYTLTFLPLLPNGAYNAAAYAVNNRGQIVGYSATDPGGSSFHAVLWQNGVAKDLGSLGGGTAIAFGINDKGQIVGESATPYGEVHPFIYEDGIMRDLLIGEPDGHAWDINDDGTVVGYSNFDATGNGPSRVWIWKDGITTFLPDAGAVAFSINNQGSVAGYYGHAVLWQNGLSVDLGTLGGASSFGLAVNNKTQVVGWAEPASGQPPHAFLWDKGKMFDLNPVGTSGVGMGINDRSEGAGQLVLADNCSSHPFIWEKGQMADLDTLLIDSAPFYGYARAINNRGQVLVDVFQDQKVACGSHDVEVPAVLNPIDNGQ